MKKILIGLLICIVICMLSGCESINLTNTVYISSIGFEHNEEDDTMKAIFYAAPTRNISRNQQGKIDKNYTITTQNNSIPDLFYKANISLTSHINYYHIQSVIFHESFLKDHLIDEFLGYIKSDRSISFNFHVLATSDNLEDIYKQQSPGELTELYNCLNSPSLLDYAAVGAKKLMLLDFANLFYDKYRPLHIPYLKSMNVWEGDEALFTNQLYGFYVYNKTNIIRYDVDSMVGIRYLVNHEVVLFESNDSLFRLYKYKIEIYECAETLCIHIKFRAVRAYGQINVTELKNELKQKIIAYCDNYIAENNSLYLVNLYNYLYSKKLNPLNYRIEITCINADSIDLI